MVQRTLRRQAQEFLDRPFVGRRAQLFEYRMSPAERALYDDVTDYLLSPTLHAFRGNARQLLLLGFHRRMASSIPALAESLDRVALRLRGMLGEGDAGERAAAEFARDLEEEDDIGEGGTGASAAPMPPLPIDAEAIRAELARVEDFVRRARALPRDSKAASLVQAVRMVMDRPADRRKVVIFTESLTTQDYLRGLLLEQTELRDEDITLFRGNNDSPRARAALDAWRDANGRGSRAPSASVAVRLALVDEFRQRSTVLISSEAGAKGLNLQFCDTVINYDLPWNPQRVEQRIGRCHHYGQKRDVTVINFLARDNQAQRLTFDILSTKLDLFGDVLDMSDVVLQTPRSDASQELVSALGPDFEGELRRIWERARSVAEVEDELRRLGESMEDRRQALERVRERTVGLIETGLDNSVRDVFRRIRTDLTAELATLDAELERMLTAYLDAAGVPWGADERDGRRVVHIGASARLPAAPRRRRIRGRRRHAMQRHGHRPPLTPADCCGRRRGPGRGNRFSGAVRSGPQCAAGATGTQGPPRAPGADADRAPRLRAGGPAARDRGVRGRRGAAPRGSRAGSRPPAVHGRAAVRCAAAGDRRGPRGSR